MNIQEIRAGLIAGRHEIPEATDGYVFNAVNPSAPYEELERAARAWLAERFGTPASTYAPAQLPSAYADACDVCWRETRGHLILYVTGYTPALVAVLNAATRLALSEVTLMHYDTATQSYHPQEVRR